MVTLFSCRSLAMHGASACEKEIPYYFAIEAQGECLPRADNFVTLDSDKKDAWGIPVLHINASYGENERAMASAMRSHVAAILDEMKLADVTPPKTELSIFGKNIHECGTARMGDRSDDRAWSTATAKCTTLRTYS